MAYQSICFLNMAINYNDKEICDYIFNIGSYDTYWYCKGRLDYGKSVCSNIDDDYWLQKCLENTN